MRFAITHDVQRGMHRLLAAPRDLPATAPWTDPPIDPANASARHREVHAEYIDWLDAATDIAEDWWNGTIQRLIDRGASRDQAIKQAYEAHFAGPAAAPELIWVIRTYWLACVAINAEVPESQRVPPEVFLLHWLVALQHDAIEVLTGMPYWPIGLSADGHWT